MFAVHFKSTGYTGSVYVFLCTNVAYNGPLLSNEHVTIGDILMQIFIQMGRDSHIEFS